MMDIRWKHLHKKDLIFILGGITLSRKWIPGYISRYLCCNVRILKNQEIVRYTDVISENKRWKGPFMVPLQTILAYKPRQRDETIFKLCHFYCLSICLILTVFQFVGAKLHFRFQNLSVFGHAFYLISYARYLSDI